MNKKWSIIGIIATVLGAGCSIVELVAEFKTAEDEEKKMEDKLEKEYGLIKIKKEEE